MVDNRQGIIRYVMWEHRKYASKKSLQNLRPFQRYIYCKMDE